MSAITEWVGNTQRRNTTHLAARWTGSITAATVYISTYNVYEAPKSTLKIYPFNSKKTSCVKL